MNQSRQRHRFTAHLREEGVHGRQWVASADSFIDAAIQFAENANLGEGDVAIVVTDNDSGKDRCFVVNLGTGDVQSC